MISESLPTEVEVKLKDYLAISTGQLDANKNDLDGLYPFFTCSENPLKINKYAFDCEAIIISGNGSKLGYTNYYNGKFNAYQRTYVLTGEKYFYIWLFKIKNNIMNIVEQAKGSAVPYITKPMLENFTISVSNNQNLNLSTENHLKIIIENITKLQSEIEKLSIIKLFYLNKFFN